MRIGVLGPLEVRDGAGRPVEVGGQRLRALLIRLAIDAGRAVTAARLVDDLWEETPPAAPGNALQALVSRLRGAGGRDLVEAARGGYRLAVDPGEVDAVEFERLVAEAAALGRPADRAAALRRALGLWRGPALTDVAASAFAAATIVRLEELRLTAIEDRIDADLALGRAGRLVPELEGLTTAHPLRERLRGLLMRALYASGRQAAALEAYEDTRRELADRLGVDPSAELAAVHLAILRRDPGLDAAPRDSPGAELRGDQGAERLTNLPVPLTSFVGREEEFRRVGKLLEETRLVTLTGPGGAGKTRLASEVTSRLVGEQPDGVWLVPLAPVSTPVDVPQAVLVALGVPDVVRVGDSRVLVPPLDRLVGVLANRRLVLVLDNCEHLIDAVAVLADRVLAEAPGVRVLATSREPLGITGETLCPVPSLPLPPPGAGAREAQEHASVRLFADRAAAVRPGFVVDADTAPLVIGICRELDGIPLAIELAAARLRSLTLTQIAGRLTDRFRLLNGGSRTALPRHQTLRAVVDWSWDLLDDAERTVLRRLSVFNGGATPQSAERVGGPDGGADVIDVIAALIDKSLVLAEGDREVRYRLLETVRAYAAERLAEAGERDRIRSAHAAYFLDLAELAEPELRRHDQLRWAERLNDERDNCNAALRHAIDTRDVVTAVRLVGALAWFWIMRDYEAEAGGWAVAVREIAGDTAPPGYPDAYAICVITAVLVTEMTGETGPTHASLAAALDEALSRVPDEPRHPALALARPVAALFTGRPEAAQDGLHALADHCDPWTRAAGKMCLGHLALHQGRIADAGTGLADAYAGFRELGDRWGMIVALSGQAQVALARGEADEAVRLGEEAYGYATMGVSPEQGSLVLVRLGEARARAGDVDGARMDMERGARGAERVGEYADAANGHLGLGELDRRAGDLAAARAHVERALELVKPRAHRADFVQSTGLTYSRLGCLAEQEGDLAAAEQWHAQALRVAREDFSGDNQELGTLVEGIAALAAAHGEHERAASLLGTARTLHGFSDAGSIEVERATAAATGALGREAFEAAYECGRRTTREQALALTP